MATTRASAASKQKLVVSQSFACEIKGEQVVMTAGTKVAANHPAVKGREHLFEEV